MFDRDILLFIDDILESIAAIEDFVNDIEYDFFVSDRKTYSATIREFIIIGEAISKIPETIKMQKPDVAWRLIKDFRNFIVHEYFGIDPEIVWDAVKKELPELKQAMVEIRQEL